MPENILHTAKPGNGQVPAGEAVRHAAEILRESVREVGQNSRMASASSAAHAGITTADEIQRARDDTKKAMQRGAEVFGDSQRQFAQQAAKQFEETSQRMTQAAQGYFDLQQRFVHEYWGIVLHGTATMLRASSLTAEAMLEPIEQRIRQRQHAGEGQEAKHAP